MKVYKHWWKEKDKYCIIKNLNFKMEKLLNRNRRKWRKF